MEMLHVRAKEPIDCFDFETANDKGHHWHLFFDKRMVRNQTVVEIPKDGFTLGLVEQGILIDANKPDLETNSSDAKNTVQNVNVDVDVLSFMEKMNFPNLSDVFQFQFDSNRKVKLGFIALDGMDYFAKPILQYLESRGVEIRKTYDIYSEPEISEICNWADLVWVEWAHRAAKQVLEFKRSCRVMVRFHRYELKYVHTLNWRNCDYVWFVNRDVMNEFLRKFEQVNFHTFFLPNVLNVEEIDFRDNRTSKHLVCYSPNFTQLKNYLYAIQLVQLLNQISSGFQLTIKAGATSGYYNHCVNYIESNDLPVHIIDNKVELQDIPNRDIVNDLLQDKDIVLSVSNYECFHYAFAEGLAAGLQGFCRADRPGRPGDFWQPYLCDNMADMAQKIVAYSELSNAKKKQIANNNRKYIQEHFSPEKISTGLMGYLFSEQPLVGIMIPTYNHAHFLKEALDSLLNGSYKNIVILVIDDGSTDDTLQLLNEYKDRIYFIVNEHLGSHPQRNIGLKILQQLGVDYLCFPCADDTYNQDYIGRMVQEAQKKDALVVYPRFNYYDQKKKRVVGSFPFYKHDKNVLLNERCYICDHSLVSSEVFDLLGWDLNWRDYGAYCFFDLWVRLTENPEWDKRIVGLNKILWKYRRYDESLSVTKSDNRPPDLKQRVLQAHERRVAAGIKQAAVRVRDQNRPRTPLQHIEFEEFEVGGSRNKRLIIRNDWNVIEIGGGANPFKRANVVTNFKSEENQRGKRPSVLPGVEMVECDVQDMSIFHDGEFDYSVCCHVLEHVEDPIAACNEIMRVSQAGYIETPSYIAELLLGHDCHRWVVSISIDNNKLVFREKKPEERDRFDDFFKKMFYENNVHRQEFIDVWFKYWQYGYVCFEWNRSFEVEIR